MFEWLHITSAVLQLHLRYSDAGVTTSTSLSLGCAQGSRLEAQGSELAFALAIFSSLADLYASISLFRVHSEYFALAHVFYTPTSNLQPPTSPHPPVFPRPSPPHPQLEYEIQHSTRGPRPPRPTCTGRTPAVSNEICRDGRVGRFNRTADGRERGSGAEVNFTCCVGAVVLVVGCWLSSSAHRRVVMMLGHGGGSKRE